MSVQVQSFFHRDSNTFSYLVSDPASGEAALIDPVLDYDPDTDASSESPLRAALQAIEQQGLQLRWLLETHAHADHVSAGRRLKQRFRRPRWPSAKASARCRRRLRHAMACSFRAPMKSSTTCSAMARPSLWANCAAR
jgi:glyoxylase-like metal-dependent hydrolase (beta-lactamase superfamily II)